MKRVVFVSALTLWSMDKGKGAPSFHKTVKKYVDEKWEVYLISNKEENEYIDFLPKENIIYVKPSIFSKLSQIKKLGLIFRIIENFITSNKFYNKAKALAVENTVLYAYEVFGVKPLKKLSVKKDLPLVTRFQGTILIKYKNNLVNRIRLTPHFSALQTSADLVIMTNDGTQGDRVLKSLQNKSTQTLFLQNGLDLMNEDIQEFKRNFKRCEFRKKIGVNDDEIMFLTLSRLVSWKKVDRTIVSFAKYLKNGNKGKLVIIGDGDSKPELMNLAKSLNVEENVDFIGAIEQKEVYKYIMSSDIFSSLYDLSNVGNPLLESMALGACIVTLNVGDTNNLIKNNENGILLDYEELNNLPKVYEDLSNNKEKRRMLGENAYKFAQDNFYSWDKRMNMEFEHVNSLLTQK